MTSTFWGQLIFSSGDVTEDVSMRLIHNVIKNCANIDAL